MESNNNPLCRRRPSKPPSSPRPLDCCPFRQRRHLWFQLHNRLPHLLSIKSFNGGNNDIIVFIHSSTTCHHKPCTQCLLGHLWFEGFNVRAASQVNNKYMSTSADPSLVVAPLVTDQVEVELLSAVNDDHGGVIVEMKSPMNSEAFVSSLRASISNWRKQGKRGVWMKLPIELANLVHPAVEEGFWYHHAEPSYLMLAYWIPATKQTLPINASHRVGVGAFVMNDKREVLAVQEKSGKFRGSGVWKFPTGVVDQGEDIFAGAIREVKEETGIDTEFVEVLAFRQSHMSFFEKSDLFFVCLLHPLSFDIQKQELEIEAAKWIPIEEYASQPFVQQHDLLKYIIDVGLARIDKIYSGFSAVSIKSAFSDRQSFIYLNNTDLKQGS